MGCDEDIFQGRDNDRDEAIPQFKVVNTPNCSVSGWTPPLPTIEDLQDQIEILIRQLNKPIYIVAYYEQYYDDVTFNMDTSLVLRSLEDAETVCKFKNLQGCTNCWKVYGPYKVGEIK